MNSNYNFSIGGWLTPFTGRHLVFSQLGLVNWSYVDECALSASAYSAPSDMTECAEIPIFIPRRVAEGGYCCHPGRPSGWLGVNIYFNGGGFPISDGYVFDKLQHGMLNIIGFKSSNNSLIHRL